MRFKERILIVAISLLVGSANGAQTFRIVTYNLNNYFRRATDSRPAKPDASREQLQHNILATRPDILAVQEMSDQETLLQLQSELREAGLDLPHYEIAAGADPEIQVAVLSRFPIVARRPHTNENYLLHGRRFRVGRAFSEVDVAVTPGYRLTLINAHLKSKRTVPQGDEAEMRLMEATLLRRRIDARLQADPNANLVVLGDFNDTKNSPPIKVLRGRGRRALVDTRPAEANGDLTPPSRPGLDPPRITWTYYYGVEDSYTRVDYILISSGMAREWMPEASFVLAAANWGLASDHRPVVATFRTED